MSLASEFKEFAMKGNVIDLAVGVVVGTAFGKIVSSLVSDIIMPPIGMAIGGVDFSDLAVTLGVAEDGKPVLWRYGLFLKTIFDFMIIAMSLFVAIKVINRLKRPDEKAPAGPTPTESLLTEIRDELKKR